MVTIADRTINLDNVAHVELIHTMTASSAGTGLETTVGLRFHFLGGTSLRLVGAEAEAWRRYLTLGDLRLTEAGIRVVNRDGRGNGAK